MSRINIKNAPPKSYSATANGGADFPVTASVKSLTTEFVVPPRTPRLDPTFPWLDMSSPVYNTTVTYPALTTFVIRDLAPNNEELPKPLLPRDEFCVLVTENDDDLLIIATIDSEKKEVNIKTQCL